MSGAEFAEHMADFERSPWGEERADLRMAITASTIVNWSGKQLKKGADAAKPIDFMPYIEKPRPDMRAQLASRFGHIVKRKTK